ncbi:carbohydrate kinase family protein [Pseudaminobacter sp. 19-2017]|uniref:Carbohydrate kinase family protein n=1 Tax=Pseudaminobacter soli (ex Zhang et al. 2022) TaxID=2831468 RepID=A0A942I2T2_9HYPH|nr:carbohydrate kinase family protein [Pseudaminobacter soli]MBS3649218.1 carbohydrate kinase family protein [Pseudaminobacter soli]
MAANFIPGASIPGAMREDVGGGTFNALRASVQRGVDGAILSVRGGDGAGEMVARAMASAGIRDHSVTFLDRATPSYTALLDREGDVVAALADMGLYELTFARQLRRSSVREAAAAADAILCDANLPADALAQIPQLAGGKPVFAIAISPAKVVRLCGVLSGLSCLFLNRREAAALTGLKQDASACEMTAALRSRGIKRAVLSAGAERVIAFEENEAFAIEPPAPRRIADVTGAGDALAGATVSALMRGLPLSDAIREGIAAALLALETESASPMLDAPHFKAALDLVPAAEPLNELERGKNHDA